MLNWLTFHRLSRTSIDWHLAAPKSRRCLSIQAIDMCELLKIFWLMSLGPDWFLISVAHLW
jgi:hypothetical protein